MIGPFTDPSCTCPHGDAPGGRLYGIDLPRGIARLSTTPGCPEHDSCQRYTAENRAIYGADGRWLYCPIHGTTDCPRRHTPSRG